MNIPARLRVAQASDLHYSGKNFEEANRCFSFAVDCAISAGVDCAVISGDSTDHSLDIHAPAVVALARNIRRLADHCPVLLLQGTFSHEPPNTLSVFRLLGGKFPVHVADRLQQVALMPDGTWRESESWRFEALRPGARGLFSCIPTVNKACVAAVVGAVNAPETVGQEIANLLAGLAPGHRTARLAAIPTAVISHGTVSGCTTEHGVPMSGLDHEFTVGSLFAAEASAVMLGHIHKHQAWSSDERLIAYPGSIGRFHYGEQGDKGFLLWDIDPAGAKADLVVTPARRTIELVFAGAPDLDAIRAIAMDAQGAFVKVTWEIPEESRASVDRQAIEAALSGAIEVKLEGRVIPLVRTRAAGISRAGSLAEKLVRWADTTDVAADRLLDALDHLERENAEAIAARILGRSDRDTTEKDRQPTPAAASPVAAPTVPLAELQEAADLFH